MTAFSNVTDAAFWTEGPHIRQPVLKLVVLDLPEACNGTLCNLYYELKFK